MAATFLKCHSTGRNGAGGAVVRLTSELSWSGASVTWSRQPATTVVGVLAGVEHDPAEDGGADGVERQLQRRHDAEVAATAAQPPEELGVVVALARTIGRPR